MTFRQIVDALWKRRLLIIVTVIVAVGVAILYLQVRTTSYSSTEVVRENSTFTQASLSGELGNVQVDFDQDTLTTQKVLGPAAKSLGLPSTALLGKVTATTTANQLTTTFNVTATAPSPEAAKQWATAAAKQYNTYLQAQADAALAKLTTQQTQASQLAKNYQTQVAANPGDPIAQASLTSALSDLGSVNDQIQGIKNAGAPLIVLTDAQPGSPTGPSHVTVLLMALAAGLIAGMGIALIGEQFDDRLRGDHEFETLTGLRSLGELVYDRGVASAKDLLPAAGTQPTALLEGMRTVRTSTQVLLPPGDQVITVTSAQPGDGKTFVAANLALSLARAGKKVVLVDGDLRRPTLRRYFHDAAEGAGLASLLELSNSGKAVTSRDTETELRSTPYAGLRVLPAGETVEAVGDLLAASDLSSIIGHLRKVADFVIIDTPPTLTVADATLIAKQSDGVILVAAVGKVNRNLLASAAEALRQNGVPLLGAIANRSRRTLPRADHQYYIKGAARSAA